MAATGAGCDVEQYQRCDREGSRCKQSHVFTLCVCVLCVYAYGSIVGHMFNLYLVENSGIDSYNSLLFLSRPMQWLLVCSGSESGQARW